MNRSDISLSIFFVVLVYCTHGSIIPENLPVDASLNVGNFSAGHCFAPDGAESQREFDLFKTSQLSHEDIFSLILSSDYDLIDPIVPATIRELKKRKAHQCWHKHSTFLDHLLGVHDILRLWGQSQLVSRVGLLHSAYSNSYVNLALFEPRSERHIMQNLIGISVEEVAHQFCIIDRQKVVVNTLLRSGKIPQEGLVVPHLRKKGETVFLSPDFLQMLIIFTMADIADQYFGWQDELFDGLMLKPLDDDVHRHSPMSLWPGLSKPGLWMSFVSKLGSIARSRDGGVENLPPVFGNCTQVITEQNEVTARDLYWDIVTSNLVENEQIASRLKECCRLNPWIFEPLVNLAQIYLHQGKFHEAKKTAAHALHLQEQWGTSWDKRLSFRAWVAWTKVLHQRAADKLTWPTNSWEVNNFGLVR